MDFFKVHSCVGTSLLFIIEYYFFAWIIPNVIHPLINCWTFGLFALFGYYE